MKININNVVFKHATEIKTGRKVYHVYEDGQLIFRGYEMSIEDYRDNMDGNECFINLNKLKTKKGNIFIHCMDTEINEQYFVKVDR